jgi:aspartate-semialdehyde dehydrogenase
MSQAFDVAVLGATGLVGQTMIEVLEQRGFPVGTLYPLASERSAGGTITFKGEEIEVVNAATFDWTQVQIGFFLCRGKCFRKICTLGR